MKALTILQPWAWAICYAGKRAENRTWAPRYRGPLLIHAGKGHGELGVVRELIGFGPDRPTVRNHPDTSFAELFRGLPEDDELVYGAHVATALLVDVVPVDQRPNDPWACGPWCLVLERVRPLAVPIPERGMQQLWEPSWETLTKLARQDAARGSHEA